MEAKIEIKPEKTKAEKRAENIKIGIVFCIFLLLCTFVYSFHSINVNQAKCDGLQAKYDGLSDSLRTVTSLVNDSVMPTLAGQSSYIAMLEINTINSINTLDGQKAAVSYIDEYKAKMAQKVKLLETSQQNLSNQINGFKGKIDTLEIASRPSVLDVEEPDSLMQKVDTVPSSNKDVKPKRRFKLSFGKIHH